MGFLSDLKTKHPEEFKLATTHKFLDQCGAGTLPKSVYRTWLTQVRYECVYNSE